MSRLIPWLTARNLAFVLLAVLAIRTYRGYRQAVRSVQNVSMRQFFPMLMPRSGLQGYRMFSLYFGFLGAWLARIPGLTLHSNFAQLDKHRRFEAAGWDVLSNVAAWPSPSSHLLVADAEAVKAVYASRTRFAKPVERYKVVTCFGDNIIAAEGDMWKRHRRVTQPAFSERNNKLVWDETTRILREMFAEWGPGVSIRHAVDDITFPIALLVVSGAGFGQHIPWRATAAVPTGHRISFREALARLSSDLFLKVFIPRWMMPLRERWRRFQFAYDEFSVYMHEMVETRRKTLISGGSGGNDLFSNILQASIGEDDKEAALTDDEVIGNVFVFLLAGHETTAHTLGFALALLALHPEEQDALYEQTVSVIGKSPDNYATYEQMSLLTRAQAVFYETLRLFPPVAGIPKVCTEHTVLSIQPALRDGCKPAEEEPRLSVAVPAGTHVRVSITGLHYNPRYWEAPCEFRPARFLGAWPRDAFMPFSGGARACLGRRFFETEGIAILAALVSRYVVAVPDALAARPMDEQRKVLLSCKLGLTQTPTSVPLVLRRRV